MSYKPTIFTSLPDNKAQTHPLEFIDQIHSATHSMQKTLAALASNPNVTSELKNTAERNYACVKTLRDKSEKLADQIREKHMTFNRSRNRS